MDATNSVSITGGGYTAEVSLLGGQLLTLTHHEDELIVPAAQTEGAFAGAVLAPWPNRTQGGSYTYAGVEHMLPVNEEATGAALHGLLLDLPLHVISQKESEVQLSGWLESSEGYPFGLDIALTYRVSADVGLAATLMARYRPEELEEDGALEAGAPLTEQDDADLDSDQPKDSDDLVDGEHEAGDLDDSDLDANDLDTVDQDDDVAELGAEDPGGNSPTEAEDAGSETAETTNADTTDADAADDDAAADEAAADDAAELNLAASASEDRETTSTDANLEEGDDVSTETSPASVPQTAPFGAGFHPYLTAGGASLTECRLRLPARTVLHTEADGAVTGREPVSQDFDLTNGPLLAGRSIDHAFTDLPEEGWTAELVHGPSGFVVRMIADSPWVQVYTGERIGRAGVAVEPMTCPPNALNSGEDLIHLVPGEWFRTGFSIEAIRVD